MSRIIKKANFTVIINPASLGIKKVNSLIFGYDSARIRRVRSIDRINEWKENHQISILVLVKFDNDPMNRMFLKIGSKQFKKSDDWRTYSNGMIGLARRDEERAERIFKAIKPSEFVQFIHAWTDLRNNGYYFKDDKNYNGFHLIRQSIVNQESKLELFLSDMLENEPVHFNGLKRWVGVGNGFTRFYLKPESPLTEGVVLDTILKPCFKTLQPIGQTFHICSVSGELLKMFSLSGKETHLNESERESIFVNNTFYKKSIYDGFETCKQCRTKAEKLVNISDPIFSEFVAYGGKTDICKKCVNDNIERATDGSIKSYGHKPRPIFHSVKNDKIITSTEEPNTNCYGLEIEVERRDSTVNQKLIAYEIIRDSDGFLYCKYDSSVSNGFEIVSHPATFNAIKKMDLQKYFLAQRKSLKGYYTNTCGMHIHINRNSFNDLQLHKFVLMMNEHEKLTKAIAQRRSESEFKWAEFSLSQANDCKTESSKIGKVMKRQKKDDGWISRRDKKKRYKSDLTIGERYQVVNLQNTATIEVRCFKANLDEVAFRKNIEFVDGLFWFCKETPIHKLTVENFIKFVKSNNKDYSNLIQFLSRTETQAKLLS